MGWADNGPTNLAFLFYVLGLTRSIFMSWGKMGPAHNPRGCLPNPTTMLIICAAC